MNRFTINLMAAAVAMATIATLALAQQKDASRPLISPASPLDFSTGTLGDAEHKYLADLAQRSVYEFEITELALQRSDNEQVQDYARKILDDHALFNKELMLLAHRKGITVAVDTSSSDRRKLEKLMHLKRNAFDAAYLEEMLLTNGNDVMNAESEASLAQDTDVKSFINQFLPGDRGHLMIAQSLKANLDAQAEKKTSRLRPAEVASQHNSAFPGK